MFKIRYLLLEMDGLVKVVKDLSAKQLNQKKIINNLNQFQNYRRNI
jgi:hypothetical protein